MAADANPSGNGKCRRGRPPGNGYRRPARFLSGGWKGLTRPGSIVFGGALLSAPGGSSGVYPQIPVHQLGQRIGTSVDLRVVSYLVLLASSVACRSRSSHFVRCFHRRNGDR